MLSVKAYCTDLLNRFCGLKCIMITDSDGSILSSVSCDDVPDHLVNVAQSLLYTISSDLCSRFQQGKNLKIAQHYANYTILQKNYNPIVVTMVCDANTPTQSVWAFEEQWMQPIVDQLK